MEIDDPLAAVVNKPQNAQNAPQSPQNTQGVQFTDDDAKSVYDEIISQRRYGQMPFSFIDLMRQDVETGELTTSQLCQVVFYVADAMRDKLPSEPSPQDIEDPTVRLYVRQWLRDRDTYTAEEYVGYTMNSQRHWKIKKKIGDEKVAINTLNTQWGKHLLEVYARKK